MGYHVVLFGFTDRDERLIELVISWAPSPKYRYTLDNSVHPGNAHIAVVDTASQLAAGQLAQLRIINPGVVVVYVSGLELSGDSRYRVERADLMLRICNVLDEAVEGELLGDPPGGLGATDTSCANTLPPLSALIVDRCPVLREELHLALARVGISTEPADGAEQAMPNFVSGGYDLIILEVSLPGVEDYDACRRFKTTRVPSVPVFLLANRASPFDRARGALAGCDAYLLKPIVWADFYSLLDRLLNKHFRYNHAYLQRRGYQSVTDL